MQTEQIKISGMTCGGCTSAVTRALQAIAGVSDVKVSLSPGEATVQYDESVTSPHQLKAAVTGAGYGVDMSDAVAARPAKGSCCS
jgi:copper chaperone CopZ